MQRLLNQVPINNIIITLPIEGKYPAKTPVQTARHSGSPAQPPRAAVRHASGIKHAREKQGERRTLAVLNIELETEPFPLEPNTRCCLGMLKADHSSPAPALLFGVGKGTLWAGKSYIWLSPRPAGAFRFPS